MGCSFWEQSSPLSLGSLFIMGKLSEKKPNAVNHVFPCMMFSEKREAWFKPRPGLTQDPGPCTSFRAPLSSSCSPAAWEKQHLPFPAEARGLQKGCNQPMRSVHTDAPEMSLRHPTPGNSIFSMDWAEDIFNTEGYISDGGISSIKIQEIFWGRKAFPSNQLFTSPTGT